MPFCKLIPPAYITRKTVSVLGAGRKRCGSKPKCTLRGQILAHHIGVTNDAQNPNRPSHNRIPDTLAHAWHVGAGRYQDSVSPNGQILLREWRVDGGDEQRPVRKWCVRPALWKPAVHTSLMIKKVKDVAVTGKTHRPTVIPIIIQPIRPRPKTCAGHISCQPTGIAGQANFGHFTAVNASFVTII